MDDFSRIALLLADECFVLVGIVGPAAGLHRFAVHLRFHDVRVVFFALGDLEAFLQVVHGLRLLVGGHRLQVFNLAVLAVDNGL